MIRRMRTFWSKGLPIVVSLVALLLSVYLLLRDGTLSPEVDSFALLGAVLTILVTILIGWQITTVLNFKDERQKWNDTLISQSKQIEKLQKDQRDNLIVVSSIIATASNKSVYTRIFKWLYIINECDSKKEALNCIDIASTYIANEFNDVSQSNNNFEESKYYVWDKKAFGIFQNIALTKHLLTKDSEIEVSRVYKNLQSY